MRGRCMQVLTLIVCENELATIDRGESFLLYTSHFFSGNVYFCVACRSLLVCETGVVLFYTE